MNPPDRAPTAVPSRLGAAGWLLLLGLMLLWFGPLDYRKLIKPDEGRYAEIAREMAVSGDWVTPRLNDLKYFEKPPLQYWATAAAYRAFGVDEWTARLWTALTGFLGILVAGYTARRLFGRRAALVSIAVLASSLLYLAMGHLNTLDMGLAFFLELAICAFLLAQASRTGIAAGPAVLPAANHWMLLAWAALALAVLSKGIVALVLTGTTLVLYSLINRDWSPWRHFQWWRGLPLFLALAAPWFVAVSLANPEFPHFFFIHEHFERYLTTVHRRVEPAWYFVPILLLGALPWTGIALHTAAAAWRGEAGSRFRPQRFLALWCLVVFAFFSASGSKLPSYILPLFPALALLIGANADRLSRRAWLIHLGAIGVLASAALLLAPQVAQRGDDETPTALLAAYGHWLLVAAAIWLAGTIGSWILAWRRRTLAALLGLATTAAIAGTLALLGHESLSPSHSAYHFARRIAPLIPADAPFYSFRMYDQTLPFYLQRTLILVDYRDELGFGLDREPAKGIAALEDFKARWATASDAFLLMQPAQFEFLEEEGLPMEEVARDSRRLVVRKPQ